MSSLARRLRRVCERLHHGALDAAAELVNMMLAEHSAHPHLTKEHGRWQLHHHPLTPRSIRCGQRSRPMRSPA